jgi:hypothetical protein
MFPLPVVAETLTGNVVAGQTLLIDAPGLLGFEPRTMGL